MMTDIEKTIEEAKAGILPFESWERLPGETSSAYSAFCAYRDFGAGRNIRKAVESSGADGKNRETAFDKRYRMWRQWSMRFQWVKRANDYDQYLDRLKVAELRKTIEEQGKAHREVTGKMLQVVNKKLDTMKGDELNLGAVAEWVETAIKADREAIQFADGCEIAKKNTASKTGPILFVSEFEGL